MQGRGLRVRMVCIDGGNEGIFAVWTVIHAVQEGQTVLGSQA